MNYSAYYGKIFSRVYVTADAENFPAVLRARQRFSAVPWTRIEDKQEIPQEHLNSSTLLVTLPRGNSVGRCPGTKGHLCCNYITMDLYMGCTLGCSYCIMKSYLNFAPITVYADPAPGLQAIREIAGKNPDRAVRVGTGEVGDSLQFDPLFELSSYFIEGLADLPNVHFEMKTKTDFVDHLLEIPRKGNAVVGFSLNPEDVVTAEEGDAVSPERRIHAAERAVGAGFRVAFHFDPIFLVPQREERYREIIRRLSVIPEGKTAWISLGTFRYPPRLKERIDERPYLYQEFVPCRDGKYRYLQRVRSEVYRGMLEELKQTTRAPVYLCMESDDLWRNVFGNLPGKISEIRDIFTPVRGVRDHVYRKDSGMRDTQ